MIDEIQLLQNAEISSVVHPTAYLNKVVIGYSNGQLELWNFKSKQLIYTFTAHIGVLTKRGVDVKNPHFMAVTCMEQSPANDVIALGFGSGDIVLINLKLDRVLFTFKQNSSAVSSLTFR